MRETLVDLLRRHAVATQVGQVPIVDVQLGDS